MKGKNITIDDLAVMVKKGFDGVDKRFDGVDKRFDGVDDRLERIEKLILANHKRRIEKLETEVKELKELLAVK
jgi:archaellum component FlaC